MMFVGFLVLIHGAKSWTNPFELIAYTGGGLGIMILPMRTYLYLCKNRSM
jgi:hypothetical protein